MNHLVSAMRRIARTLAVAGAGFCWLAPLLLAAPFPGVAAWAAEQADVAPSQAGASPPVLAKAITREGKVWNVPPPEVPLPTYPVARRGFRDGEKYRYEFGWQGIPAAEAELAVVEFEEGGVQKVRVKARAWTLDWLKWMWKMNDEIDTIFLRDTVSPIRFFFRQREKRDRIDTTLTFYPDEKVARSTRVKNDDPVERIFPYSQAYDPVTAAFLLRSVDLQVGDEKTAEVLNGKGRYLIRVKVAALEKISVKPGEFLAYRLEPAVEPVHMRKGAPRKIKTVTIWLSADERRIPIRIESEVFVGSVYGEWLE